MSVNTECKLGSNSKKVSNMRSKRIKRTRCPYRLKAKKKKKKKGTTFFLLQCALSLLDVNDYGSPHFRVGWSS